MANVREKINFDDGVEYAIPASRRPPGGVSIRRDPLTGADVFMYKRKPGVYYSGHGTEVATTMAERAGFDVQRELAQRDLILKKAEFERNWAVENRGSDVRTVVEYNGFRLDNHPKTGYYVVHIETGDIVTSNKRAVSEQEGRDWLEAFAGKAPETFDGTPESVKVADGDIQRTSDESFGRVDRRSRPDAKPARKLRPAGDQEAAISA